MEGGGRNVNDVILRRAACAALAPGPPACAAWRGAAPACSSCVVTIRCNAAVHPLARVTHEPLRWAGAATPGAQLRRAAAASTRTLRRDAPREPRRLTDLADSMMAGCGGGTRVGGGAWEGWRGGAPRICPVCCRCTRWRRAAARPHLRARPRAPARRMRPLLRSQGSAILLPHCPRHSLRREAPTTPGQVRDRLPCARRTWRVAASGLTVGQAASHCACLLLCGEARAPASLPRALARVRPARRQHRLQPAPSGA